MSDNIFDRGESRKNVEGYIKRHEDAMKGYTFESNTDVDIDGLPTRTAIRAKTSPIDNVFRPDPDNEFFDAYYDSPVTSEALDYFKKNSNATSVDFNIAYPGYTNFDFHPYSFSDKSEGFTNPDGILERRSPIFAHSLKDRIKNVNRVFDANPQFNDQYTQDYIGQDRPFRRINLTPEDSKNLSTSLNTDLSRMIKEAPEGTMFVNNPDSPSRGKLYSRAANFGTVDEAGNQFVRRGNRGSLTPAQITDNSKPFLGTSNFDSNPGPIRTIKEMISPDSVPEIKNLPSFQRGLYQKPTATDLVKSTVRFAGSPEAKARMRTGLKGGLTFGAADLVPSAEVVNTIARDGLKEGGKQFVQEAAMGVPVAMGVGGLTALAPAAAPFVAPAALAMAGTEGIRTVDAITRAITGEGLGSKLRQTIGTEQRTGYSSPGNSLKEQIAREAARVDNPPQITAATNVRGFNKNLSAFNKEFNYRTRLAGERFNPSKLEFGLSEIFQGRQNINTFIS